MSNNIDDAMEWAVNYVNESNLVMCSDCGEFKSEDLVPEDMCTECLGEDNA